jgi:acetyl esterase/lipase
VQDAVNAYLWLRETAGDQGKIVAAGDSSAGGLVMSLLLALPERGLPVPALPAHWKHKWCPLGSDKKET